MAVAAAVAGSAVDPAGFHPPATDSTVDQADEHVLPRSAVLWDRSGVDGLRGDEISFADQCWVGRRLRDDPVLGGVPPTPLRSIRPVVRVSVSVLPVPDLATGVARIARDRRDTLHRPSGTAAM